MDSREETDVTVAPEALRALVARFREHVDDYRAGRYNETQLRRDYLDPFFALLGWDVHNQAGYAELYREVVHEDSIKVVGDTKAPDYGFRIGGQRKFFVEAKKPSINIKGDPHPAYQVRRYAWSAKLPLSILSDFEELAVYDCTVKPEEGDKASTARVMYFGFEEYEEKWDEIASIFSKEAILKGSFDKYAQSKKKKRGTTEVDKAFLAEIEEWRELLARNIALRNPEIDQRGLNFGVQRTIDRIIFLRICEDRGIEDYGSLRQLLNGKDVYRRLFERFRLADQRYNSGLFHFTQEKGRPDSPDTLTPSLEIDDKVLKDVLGRLYYPKSPYEFSVLPADILGQVYEQFLGKVIRLTEGHRAKVEEKPEVRKAGGVYYTPTYIVDYIVEHTVGDLLEGKTPQEAGGLTKAWKLSKTNDPIRVLDPACGSGSFLIGAYQYLLDWYLERYVEDGPEKHTSGSTPRLIRLAQDDYRLTTDERKRILLAHIYGVDIDRQAVEVTKLSLLLKVLEGESEQSLGTLFSRRERVLPDLSQNVKCGNSLIGSDFYEGKQVSAFDDEAHHRINAFDWEEEFPEVFANGGFDAVIGNPPYVRIQHMKEWAPLEVEFYKKAYRSASSGNFDIYVAFIERGHSLLNSTGRLGFIVSQKFFQVGFGGPVRDFLSEGQFVGRIVNFTHNQVFEDAFINTCILILSKQPRETFAYTAVPKVDGDTTIEQGLSENVASTVLSSHLGNAPWILQPELTLKLLQKLNAVGVPLSECTRRIFQGLKTSADKIYVLDLVEMNVANVVAYSNELNLKVKLEASLCQPLLKGTEMRPFVPLDVKRIILFPYENKDGGIQLIKSGTLESDYPLTYQYFSQNEKKLRGRERGKMDRDGWYGYGRTQALDVVADSKIITPDLAPHSSFLLDDEGRYFFLGGAAGGYGIIPVEGMNMLYLLGILNSSLLNFYITCAGQQMESGYFSFEARFIRSAPICLPIESGESGAVSRNDVISLVEEMLQLCERRKGTRTAHDKNLLQRRIAATDRQIDRLVYELYDLSAEEIAIVEGKQ